MRFLSRSWAEKRDGMEIQAASGVGSMLKEKPSAWPVQAGNEGEKERVCRQGI